MALPCPCPPPPNQPCTSLVHWRCAQVEDACASVPMLKWACSVGCPLDERTAAEAARRGALEVLQWARRQGCHWDASTCAAAAEGGHLAVLRWARRKGCEWGADTCSSAAEGGHLKLLRWAREAGCEWDEDTCQGAAEGGHLEVLQWASRQVSRLSRRMANGSGCMISIMQESQPSHVSKWETVMSCINPLFKCSHGACM